MGRDESLVLAVDCCMPVDQCPQSAARTRLVARGCLALAANVASSETGSVLRERRQIIYTQTRRSSSLFEAHFPLQGPDRG